jgi:hypothetical protein
MEVINVEPVSLVDLKPVESGRSIDLNQYDKQQVKIEKAEVINVKSEYSTKKTQWVLRVSSEVLTKLEDIEFRASALFNLIQDEDGNLKGYPTSEDSNLVKFMKDIKAKDPKEIVGKNALIKSYDKNGKTFLTFRY